MIYFKNPFKFPGPKDLGMSDNNNAMPSEFFRNNQTEITWEMYYKYLAKTYPIKFFLVSTIPGFFRSCWIRISRPFKDAHYWLVSHTIRQYHWLDLRQPKNGINNINSYRYGWCDTDKRVEYALINLFKEFVELELTDSYFVPSEEDAAKDDGTDFNYCGFRNQLNNYKEIMSIYNWLTKERAVEEKEESDALNVWYNAKQKWSDDTNKLYKKLQLLEARNKAKLEEILIRIVKIRHVLWT
jgi:hypothetical protein